MADTKQAIEAAQPQVQEGEASHRVHFAEAASPRSENELLGEGAAEASSPRGDIGISKTKKERPQLKSQGSLGQRIMTSLSRTLSLITPRRKDDEDWESVDVPDRYLNACHGNKKKAVKMYRAMLKWRKENGIDEILNRPYPHWDDIKRTYPHAMHHRGRKDEFVSIEMPGKMDIPAMKKAGITPAMMGLHLAFVFEYAFTKVDTREEVQTITIMDCTGLSLTAAASVDNLSLIKAACEVNSHYYPGRAHKILAVNPPRFFGPVFNLIKNVLPNGLDKVVECVSHAELHKYVSPDVLPPHLGGTNKVPVGESEQEKGIHAFVQQLNATKAA